MESKVADLMNQSMANLHHEIETLGWKTVFLDRVTRMADRGDLALLGVLIDQKCRMIGNNLLANIPDREVHMARAELLALRDFFLDLKLVDETDDSARKAELTHNPFEMMTTSDNWSPLEMELDRS